MINPDFIATTYKELISTGLSNVTFRRTTTEGQGLTLVVLTTFSEDSIKLGRVEICLLQIMHTLIAV